MVKSNRKKSVSTKYDSKKSQFDFSREKKSKKESESWKKMKNRLEK